MPLRRPPAAPCSPAPPLARPRWLCAPHPPPNRAPPATAEHAELLFVQAAGSGTVTQSGQGTTLFFRHDTGQTVYFSDRPDRLVGLVPTADFIGQWPFEDESPPNAALAISTAQDPSAHIFVGVLSNPVWDAGSATLSYRFTELSDDIPASTPIPIPDSFASATLFIDGSSAIGTFRDKNPPLPIPGEM